MCLAGQSGDVDSLPSLQHEVVQLFEKYSRNLPLDKAQDVTVYFMINAKNEMVITDVQADSEDACEYVKEVLGYKKLKYNKARQLTGYSITLRLVPEYG
jgi:hypothetical protein